MPPAGHGISPDNLSIHTATRDGIQVVTLTGEIDHHVSGPLHDVLQGHAQNTGRLVVDFAGVSFMDSTGIRVLLSTAQSLRDRPDAWMRIAAPSAPVLHVLELVGLDTVLAVYPTVSEALTA